MSAPSISVIIPTYNRAQIVGAAIESVLCQASPPEEVIVVDDGSTDDTLVVLREFGNRIIVVSQPNGGAAAARNTGAARASGDWLAFNDSDDRWCAGRMALLRQDLAAAGEDVVAHVANVRFLGTGEPRLWFDLIGLQLASAKVATSRFPLRHFLHSFFLIGAAFRRDWFAKLGGFDTSFIVDEDSEFAHRLADHGDFMLRGDVVAESIRVDGDVSALSLLRAKDPLTALALKERQFRGVMENSLKPVHAELAARALSACMLDQAALIRTGKMPGDYRRTMLNAAAVHPNPVKGYGKMLLQLLRPTARPGSHKNSFRAAADP